MGQRLLAVCLGLCLGSCATTPDYAPSFRSEARVELTAVPFFPQEAYQCGPAALAMVLAWSGVTFTPEALEPALFVPARLGTLPLEMAARARQQGRAVYRLPGRIDAVLGELSAGHPVLVLQNRGLDWWPIWHYAVAVGFDLERESIVLRSGLSPRHEISLSRFVRTWERGGRWALLVLPAAELPATLEEREVMGAGLELEGAQQWEAAADLYRAAGGRWPRAAFHFGFGNALHALERQEEAAAAYRAAVTADPGFAPAHNNLALLLAERGRWEEALVAARRAVALGGEHRAEYVSTLESIRCRAAKLRACAN